MTPSVGKKLSLFVGLVALMAVGIMGYLSYQLIEAKFAEILRKDTLDAATLLSSRIRNELRHVAEKGRILSAAALEEFKSFEDQVRWLENNLTIDEQLLAITLYRKSSTGTKFSPVFRLTRPEDDTSYISEEEFKDLDLKYPLDLGLASEGAVEVSMGALSDGTPILRMAIPVVRKKGVGFTQVLGIEVRQERLTAAFAEATANFSFVLDRHGRVLIQTDPTHFTLGEDLSHLPILQMASSTDAPNGNLDYYELPGSVLQYASFHKVGYGELTVVSQAPQTHVIKLLRIYTRQAAMLGLACVFLAMAFSLVAAWGIVGGRLARIGAVLGRIGDGKFKFTFPDTFATDEIGTFAQILQKTCNDLEVRERVHGTHAKFNNRRARAWLAEGKVNVKGERAQAFVLTCHLHGLEAVIEKAHADQLVKFLNKFHESVAHCVKENNGIVDRILGGTIIAYWGLPVSDEEDGHGTLTAALKMRQLVKDLNETLQKARLPEITPQMGLHYGPVLAGELGSEDRLEYTVAGEALVVSNKIYPLAEQFGTDLVMTGHAVDKSPKWFKCEKISSADEHGFELYELVAALDRKEIEAAEAKKAAKGKKRRKGTEVETPPVVAEAPAQESAPFPEDEGTVVETAAETGETAATEEAVEVVAEESAEPVATDEDQAA